MSEQKVELLKKLWYERNPSHEANLDTGEDMFWQTVLCVYDDYSAAQPPYNTGKGDEGVLSVICDALYATGKFTTDNCEDLADAILLYLKDAGFECAQLSAPNTGKGGVIPDDVKKLIEEAAYKEEIYPRKYGSGTREGYSTMMLYEINSERSECFENGAIFGYNLATSSPISVGDGCRAALQELVYLKSIKDIEEYKEEYERRKPIAWAAAKKAIAAPFHQRP